MWICLALIAVVLALGLSTGSAGLLALPLLACMLMMGAMMWMMMGGRRGGGPDHSDRS
jgi:hypothetical protein